MQTHTHVHILTMGILMVHHVQLILISLHIPQKIVCRDVTALSLLIV